MNRHIVSLSVLLASLAFAQAKTKEEAQAEVDKGKTKSCEVTKKLLNPKLCGEEIEKAKAFDCASPRSFKIDDVLGLNASCVAKAKAGARGAAEATASSSSGGAKSETKCKVLDPDGAVVLQDTDASSLSCQRKVKDQLTKKCDGSTKKLQFQFVSEVLGKETKPTRLTVYCPKS